MRYLKLWFSWTSLSVTEEGDVCGTQRVVLVVVLRAVSVGQLDHAIIVGKPGVKLAEIPRACATAETKQKWLAPPTVKTSWVKYHACHSCMLRLAEIPLLYITLTEKTK